MLTVTIRNGDDSSREFWVNDLYDLRNVQSAITDEFQKVLAQDDEQEKNDLKNIIEASPYDNAKELIEWLKEVADFCEGDPDRISYFADLKKSLDGSDYDNVEDMIEELDRLNSAMFDIYYTARNFC